MPALRRLAKIHIPDINIVDTLVCSRLFSYNADGGHSLDAWGKRLKLEKGDFNEWLAYPEADLEADRLDRCVQYCVQDCRVNLAVWRYLSDAIHSSEWRQSLRCEHDIAIICRDMQENGFLFDLAKAEEIYARVSASVEELTEALQRAFPPRSNLIREITPRLTRHGTLHRGDFRWLEDGDLTPYTAGHAFSRIEWVPFNPGSPGQVVDILNKAGWSPIEKTKGHKQCERDLLDERRKRRPNAEKIRELEAKLSEYDVTGWSISEENLATLPADAPAGCQLFVKWRMLSKRKQTLEEWFEAYNPRDGRIHGTYNGIGTWTHRMSHNKPNQGNVPSVDSKYHAPELKDLARTYGRDMRSCFHVPSGHWLVGTDADGIQLRILAHYMDDPEFTEALVNGDKEKGTDAHTLNAIKLGVGPAGRARAKTFIYAWLLGAGSAKIGKILGLSSGDAREAIESFVRGYPGLVRLKTEVIPADAERGYFEGFDGRLVKSDEYHMLAGYLQNGEACIMKHANILWRKELRDLGIPFKQVNFVHDEWQTEVPGEKELAIEVGRIQADAIRRTAESFGLRCPFAGNSQIGLNWYETH